MKELLNQPFVQVALPIVIAIAIAALLQNKRLDELSKRIDELSRRLDDVIARLGRIEEKLGGHESRIAVLESVKWRS